MRRPRRQFNPWDVIELASQGVASPEIARLWNVSPSMIGRRFATELAQGQAERTASFRQFAATIPSYEGHEAIYWERFAIVHVRVCEVQLSSTSVFARIHLIPFVGRNEDSLMGRRSWPFACSWRQGWHWDQLLWVANDREIFFSRDIIDEVVSIRAAFPSKDKFEPYDKHFNSMRKPLDSCLVRLASRHLRNVNDLLRKIEAGKHAHRNLRAALQALDTSLRTSGGCATVMEPLLEFICKAGSEAGKSLTDSEAGQLIRKAYRVGRVLGGPF